MSTNAPSPWIVRWSHLVPGGGHVLDVACGSGRHARWFAEHGHAVTAVDRDADAIAAMPQPIDAVVADLEGAPWPFGARRFEAVVVTNYLWRALMPTLVDALADGGVLLYETFALGHEAIGRPRKPEFLLQRGELLEMAASLRVVAFEDGYDAVADRQVQRIVAVREAADKTGSRRYLLASEAASATRSGGDVGHG